MNNFIHFLIPFFNLTISQYIFFEILIDVLFCDFLNFNYFNICYKNSIKKIYKQFLYFKFFLLQKKILIFLFITIFINEGLFLLENR